MALTSQSVRRRNKTEMRHLHLHNRQISHVMDLQFVSLLMAIFRVFAGTLFVLLPLLYGILRGNR